MKTFVDDAKHRLGRISCRRVRAALVEYLEGQLRAAEQDMVAAHLKSCPRCAAEQMALKKTLSIMGQRDIPEPDQQFWMELKQRVRERIREDRVSSRWPSPVPARTWAPAVVVAAVLVFLFLWWTQHPLPPAPGPEPILSRLELEGRQSLQALGQTDELPEAILVLGSPRDSLTSLLVVTPQPTEVLERALIGTKMAENPDLWESVIEEKTYSLRPLDALIEELSEEQLRKLSARLSRLMG
jgi:hypothetical protein